MDGLFESIMISGTGDVANRIERTCRRMGIEVLSAEVPEPSHPLLPHCEEIIAAAKRIGVKALHPGYVGPRSRTELALLARAEGIAFVGPSNEALAMMADKVTLSARAEEAGLHPIPKSSASSDKSELRAAAETLGYPVFLKPVTGTAGIGVVLVDDEEDFGAAFDASTEAARTAFGDTELYVERAIERPRHIELTIILDADGKEAALSERECSVQRRHQVSIAETPSPWLSAHPEGEAIREMLINQALCLAERLTLVGVFTVEFLVDVPGRVWFLEANADMQGAVLVTEMVTGHDPIELALATAAGRPVVDEERLVPRGHAFEARVCAEDPDDGFRRSSGPVTEMRFPPAPQRKVRIEPSIAIGEEAPRGVEPLLARIATFAPGRHDALLWLDRTLAETVIEGPANNIAFLRRILNHESFRAGAYDTAFAQRILSE
jgi:acetyl/propionyl-CoA carboxylase alpha subunit